MKDYTSEIPKFSKSIKILEVSDVGHADNVNVTTKQLLENTLSNRQTITDLETKAGAMEEYHEGAAYHAGEYCLYHNELYRCIQDTEGPWDEVCWKRTDTLEEIGSLNKELSKLERPAFDDSGEVEGITSFTNFLNSIVSKMPIITFFRNFKAGMKFVLHAGQLVTDCVTDRDDLPAAACTVKDLMDLYTQLNSDMLVIKCGFAKVNVEAINTPAFTTVTFDKPFTQIMSVCATGNSGVPGTYLLGVSVLNVTNNDFKIYVTRANNPTIQSVSWIAIGK